MAAGLVQAIKGLAVIGEHATFLFRKPTSVQPTMLILYDNNDAMESVLKELGILKPEHMDVFSEFERYLDMGHNYLGDNSEEYFGRPYWETTDLNKNHQRNIDEFKAIPHK